MLNLASVTNRVVEFVPTTFKTNSLRSVTAPLCMVATIAMAFLPNLKAMIRRKITTGALTISSFHNSRQSE